MLPPAPMLATKNRICSGAIIFCAIVILAAGCSPPGSSALLKGKKLLERGDYAAAVAELKTATSLLTTNAQAWNYYGVALQHAGQPADAVLAYQRALTLDRDLVEAHYNLGCLWLEQNKPDDARSEFTAYTLRRSNTPEGWLKLGAAQLRANDVLSAEKSFSTALHFSPDDAEALNGLGLARIQRGRAREAAEFFAAAVRAHPDYAPAILNLATVEQQYLHDDKSALQHYREYLALAPHPANWDEVNAIVNSLEQSATTASPSDENEIAATPKTNVSAKRTPAPNPARTAAPSNVRASSSSPSSESQTESVPVQPEPVIVGTPVASAPLPESPSESASQKQGALNRMNPLNWFRSGSQNEENAATPLPSKSNPAPTVVRKPVRILPPSPPTYPRYLYLSPAAPRAGDHPAAERAFTRAREAELDSRWKAAMESYEQAAQFDSSWFEAQYNYGVMAYRAKEFNQSLAAYEMALAIQPDSVNARYNFALALKAAGYAPDAVNELEKILASHPDEVRAHLALGNLYAQQFYDAPRARQHYLKVLELDPRNPQATDIQFWLSANPP
ncbi:MAG TPA: tetratricopeptide repeat protein [Verrucomicrobiae bacterium]|jgi:tetratricopeptide (TPR) repeat protein|nr:tetratricopeptide repeat protein [Verrucomicrobiae bacterium]